ncbi:VOC family protein [Umezawaea sp. Da 62-37]|uniref:VOC family protein n=1 Tax=Umezawaea sp. Da 62-37 TaxID=3075927 RepID=UPI0028F6D082|nr:VOC family protein [Umezawaea sp. Da 62-37]WNV82545.1 VOC family protein [Umezawaea sp. Da 62-37]
MACRITELVLDCADPDKLADFWCGVLGFQVLDRDPDGIEIGRADQAPEDRITIVLNRVDEPKKQKLRMHVDVNSTDRDQAAELERLLALGAKRVDIGQGGVRWIVLADPEGNEFCLLRRRVTP